MNLRRYIILILLSFCGEVSLVTANQEEKAGLLMLEVKKIPKNEWKNKNYSFPMNASWVKFKVKRPPECANMVSMLQSVYSLAENVSSGLTIVTGKLENMKKITTPRLEEYSRPDVSTTVKPTSASSKASSQCSGCSKPALRIMRETTAMNKTCSCKDEISKSTNSTEKRVSEVSKEVNNIKTEAKEIDKKVDKIIRKVDELKSAQESCKRSKSKRSVKVESDDLDTAATSEKNTTILTEKQEQQLISNEGDLNEINPEIMEKILTLVGKCEDIKFEEMLNTTFNATLEFENSCDLKQFKDLKLMILEKIDNIFANYEESHIGSFADTKLERTSDIKQMLMDEIGALFNHAKMDVAIPFGEVDIDTDDQQYAFPYLDQDLLLSVQDLHKKDWKSARDDCRQYGLRLANLKSFKEYEALVNATDPEAKNSSQVYWVSGSNMQGTGGYSWLDGTEIAHFLWDKSTNQPRQLGNRPTCAILSNTSGLRTKNCINKYNYICEVGMEYLECLNSEAF